MSISEEQQRDVDLIVVGNALDWAYRQGYSYGEQAANAFARLHGLTVGKRDLGLWGDALTFTVKEG